MADITPVTREEFYLAKAGGQDVPTPSPVPREEQYLAKLSGQDIVVPTPKTRREKFLYAASGGDIELPSEDKMLRIEKFMAKAGGRDVTTPTAVTREEKFWDAITAESGIKRLTGRLPLFFRTSENKLRDWTIYGNNQPGKNLLDISSFGDVDINNTVMTLNDDNATVSVYTTDILTEQAQGLCNFMVDETGNYLFSGVPEDAPNSALNTYIWDRDASGRAKAWDKTTDMSTQSKSSPSVEVYLEQGVRYQLRVRVQVSYGAHITPVIVSPMIRKAGTSEAFEPYQIGVGERTENGYVLNIGVGFAPIPTQQPVALLETKKTINIGESPLTEGQTLSMSQFGDIDTKPYADMFIAAFKGFRYDDQLSSNQPEMKIKFKEYEG